MEKFSVDLLSTLLFANKGRTKWRKCHFSSVVSVMSYTCFILVYIKYD